MGWLDRLLLWLSSVTTAIPSFWLAMVAVMLFGFGLKLFPYRGAMTAGYALGMNGGVFWVVLLSGFALCIMVRLVTRRSLFVLIGTPLSLVAALLGATLGIVSAYFGRVSASVILNIINVLLVIPATPLMMILSNLSSSYLMMIAVFTGIGWCGTARMVRAQVLSIMNMNYIRAAELAGGSRSYIMFRHIMPGVSHLLIMNCAMSCAGFMIAEAGLSFIGLGDPSVISWGKILVAAQESAFTSGLWAWVIAPGAAIFVTVYGFMQIGAALEEILNPKMKRQSSKAEIQDLHALLDSMEDIGMEAALAMKEGAGIT